MVISIIVDLFSADIEELCRNAPPIYNTTCSWNRFEESSRNQSSWFRGCACYMAQHQSGP